MKKLLALTLLTFVFLTSCDSGDNTEEIILDPTIVRNEVENYLFDSSFVFSGVRTTENTFDLEMPILSRSLISNDVIQFRTLISVTSSGNDTVSQYFQIELGPVNDNRLYVSIANDSVPVFFTDRMFNAGVLTSRVYHEYNGATYDGYFDLAREEFILDLEYYSNTLDENDPANYTTWEDNLSIVFD